ncbi:MAG: hypothetical protein HQK89_14580, partial [Nitrospirae bacterium]|nr:hypothetical protein [Nitrospirota bacterium]
MDGETKGCKGCVGMLIRELAVFERRYQDMYAMVEGECDLSYVDYINDKIRAYLSNLLVYSLAAEGESAMAQLIAALDDEDTFTGCALALGLIGNDRALAALIESLDKKINILDESLTDENLDDDDLTDEEEYIVSADDLGEESIYYDEIAAMAHECLHVTGAALSLSGTKAIDMLIEKLYHRNPFVIMASSVALGKIGDKRAIKHIVQLIRELRQVEAHDELICQVEDYLIGALAGFNTKDKAALKEIKKCLRSMSDMDGVQGGNIGSNVMPAIFRVKPDQSSMASLKWCRLPKNSGDSGNPYRDNDRGMPDMDVIKEGKRYKRILVGESFPELGLPPVYVDVELSWGNGTSRRGTNSRPWDT